MKEILLAALVVLKLLSGFHFAQSTFQTQIHKADSLALSKQYFDAITEYKRVLFFYSSNNLEAQLYFKIAQCYKAGAHFDEAIKYFSFAENKSLSDSISFQNKIEIIKCNILRKTTSRALQLCDELNANEEYFSYKNEINYWRGWAYMFADDWSNAAKCFSINSANKELQTLCEQTESAKLSVTFAKVISYILPGAGQIYSGKIFSGLMSLAWNLASAYFTINAFIANRAFDGIVIGQLVWLRFYRGNVENAENFAIQKNLEVSNRALKFLQNEYKGLKP